MLRRWAALVAVAVVPALVRVPAALSAPRPIPTPTPPPDAQGERIFAAARAAWARRQTVPFLRYGALVRYLHNGHVFDNWWDAYYRSDDGALSLEPLHDIDEEKRRLGGVPFSIFGFTIFDTNPDAEPIRLDDPRIAPVASFGILTRGVASRSGAEPAGAAPSPRAESKPPDASNGRGRRRFSSGRHVPRDRARRSEHA